MRMFGLVLCCAATAMPSNAVADQRIVHREFDPEKVVELEGCIGYQTMIEFGDGEKIENVGVGDSSQWLVSQNGRGNLLFIRPAFETTHSNMTIATDRHRYVFELSADPTSACDKGEAVYFLQFNYPMDELARPQELAPDDIPAPEAQQPALILPPDDVRNTEYTFTGAIENVPMRVFDDGQSTFFSWSEGAVTPAVYAVSTDEQETMVNFSSRGGFLVANLVAPEFRLRRGTSETSLFNESYTPPKLDEFSPQPREEGAGQIRRDTGSSKPANGKRRKIIGLF